MIFDRSVKSIDESTVTHTSKTRRKTFARATDLFINQGDDRGVDAHPCCHADEVHLLEKDAVDEGVDEEQRGVQIALPHLNQGTWRRSCRLFYEVYQQAEQWDRTTVSMSGQKLLKIEKYNGLSSS